MPIKRRTNRERLLSVLCDGRWHSTKELVRRVSHTFANTKFKLVQSGYVIHKRRHPRRRFDHQYRLEVKGQRRPS